MSAGLDFNSLFEDMPTIAEWHEWRLQGIGSSDGACLYGCGYKTELKLFEEKTSPTIQDDKPNYAMQRGKDFEDIARKMFAEEFSRRTKRDEKFDPKNMVSAEHDFIRASLDGISSDGKTIIEIKYQGLDAHNSMEIPRKFWVQMQHQLFVSKADLCYFVSYNPDSDIRLKTKAVFPDGKFLDDHIKNCKSFWDKVLSNQKPGPSNDDFVKCEKYDMDLESKYISTKRQIDSLEAELSILREDILSRVTHPKTEFGLLRIVRHDGSNKIDYKKLLNDKNISEDDIKKYSSQNNESYRITLGAEA